MTEKKFHFGPQHALVNRVGCPTPMPRDLGTCKRCGANLRKVRIEHTNAIKGDDDWSDVTACPNDKCPDYWPGRAVT